MKKLSLIFTITLGLFFSLNLNAQTNPDFYLGKWLVTVVGTPQGDSKMTYFIKKVDNKITGSVLDSTGKEITKFTKVEVKDKTLDLGFMMQTYEITVSFTAADKDHIKGTLMGMFDATGVRLKEKE